MRNLTITTLLLISTTTFAGISLRIEHPRHPFNQLDTYSIACEKECELRIKAQENLEGKSKSSIFENKIKELVKLHTSSLPVQKSPGRILYTVNAIDGEKKFQVTLGYPKSYEGLDFSKYTQWISAIEGLKREMKYELEEKK